MICKTEYRGIRVTLAWLWLLPALFPGLSPGATPMSDSLLTARSPTPPSVRRTLALLSICTP